MTFRSSSSGIVPSASGPALTSRGEARFWRVSLALFLGGFATFALLYCGDGTAVRGGGKGSCMIGRLARIGVPSALE